MKHTRIIGLLIRDRIKEAGRLQITLSNHAQLIRSRLGFHELNENTCSRTGIIVLTLTGEESAWTEFQKELESIDGVDVQQMSFVH
jgi:hypothetical protein